MDLAYDHIQESVLPKDDDKKKGDSKDPNNNQPQASLNEDLQEAYKALSTSAWGMRIGGFLGNAVKQGQSVYKEASKEVTELGGDAAKGFTSIINRTRSLTVNTTQGEASGDKSKETDNQTTPTKTRDQGSDEAMSNSETYMTKFRAEAARRLKELQKAEDAADEALLRFGTNISNFLKEAVSIAPPSDSNQGNTVLFESKDAQGKRVIHTSRQDAQLHVIHTSTESFTKDPATEEFAAWSTTFDAEKKTTDISDDLKKYPELRATMEKMVPDQVPYADFWKRYYFLRHGIEAAEARRRDLLKAASAEDEVSWDDDSDDESAPAPAPKVEQKPVRPPSAESSTTIQPPAHASQSTLKPNESRKSNDEKSQADSEASYDVVGAASGVQSRAPNSPKESRKADDSDDDWE
nr:BSD domain-containing protein [Colletotrichum truncatum]KAF6797783.1 BSD domain-containing protein [Colletotrichum truncatum]